VSSTAEPSALPPAPAGPAVVEAAALTRGRESTGASPGAPRNVAYLYLLPGLVIFGLFVAWPVLRTAYLSLFQWDGVNIGKWVALNNYLEVLRDPIIRSGFTHSLLLIVFFSIFPVSIALFITAVMTRRTVRGLTVYRTVLFVPQVVSLVVIGIAWKWMYSDGGIVNEVLGLFGVTAPAWLGDFTWSLPAIAIIGTWLMTPLCLVLFLSGVQKIDGDLYDAARVDGANARQEFFAVTLPGLRAEMSVALTITMISALKTFDLVFVLTKGGPGNATTVPGVEIYQRAFDEGKVGSAASIAIVLMLVIFVATFAIGFISRTPE
jgi:raffinose/stachyose/melibiose transport system permease protein